MSKKLTFKSVNEGSVLYSSNCTNLDVRESEFSSSTGLLVYFRDSDRTQNISLDYLTFEVAASLRHAELYLSDACL